MTFMPRNEQGLTLIEVLIALVILSIALTAIIKSAAENIRNTLYLQNKMIATWIGTDVISNVRAKLLDISDPLKHQSQTLGQTWIWEASLHPTPNPRIKQIVVDVYHQPENNKVAHLESYF